VWYDDYEIRIGKDGGRNISDIFQITIHKFPGVNEENREEIRACLSPIWIRTEQVSTVATRPIRLFLYEDDYGWIDNVLEEDEAYLTIFAWRNWTNTNNLGRFIGFLTISNRDYIRSPSNHKSSLLSLWYTERRVSL
jgi:hypothetical protein